MAPDPKEVRIGSHVEYRGDMCRVSYIAPKDKIYQFYLRRKGCPFDIHAHVFEVNPILITPELLTELGFKYHEYDNGKLWELDFPDLYKAYLYLKFDEDTTSTYNFRMWNMKEYEIYGRVQTLHELENWIYLMYGKELIND